MITTIYTTNVNGGMGISMYKIAICDDDKDYIKELEDIILECNEMQLAIEFYEFNSGEKLLHSKVDDMDVIFLDILMQGMNGNETAVRLIRSGYQGILVQCSGIFMPTPETIKISPFRYLLKQDEREKNLHELKEIIAQMVARKVCYEIEGSYLRQKMYFRVADIVYITHHSKGSVLHLRSEKAEQYQDGKIIVPYDFEQLLELFEAADFSIPHNSYMVNLRYVSDFNAKTESFVVDGKRLVMSRGKKEVFLNDLAKYTRKKYREKMDAAVKR